MNVDEEGGEEGMKIEKLVFMWGYLPGALPQRAPILSPVVVRLPCGENAWKDVCGGGCGFAMAISGYLELRFCHFSSYFSCRTSILSEFVVLDSAFEFPWELMESILHRKFFCSFCSLV